MRTLPFTDARANLKRVIDQMMETVHLLRSPANAAHLERSIAQARAGEVQPRTLVDDSE
ncbi:type II toxin-antitoxin system Phd/YefM family antitoxin [Paraburkholderia sp. BR10936]|uniref:type II toxin-antitoxin system Phd/YefM family antitoxin n=1 Tax=Paraburkholderia sp. BR10936 TaxID=3236993 RepID=UPI0034D2101E